MQKPHVIFLTKEGIERLQNEEKGLLEKRPTVLEELKRAREMGDLSENGAYKAAKMRIGQIDSRLRYLHRMLLHTKLIEKKTTDTIGLGSTVVLQEGSKQYSYLLVGEHEANPSEGKVSDKSPIGKMIFGKKKGESIEIDTPTGKRVYQILKIS